MNYNNQDNWAQEQLYVSLHYVDEGDGEYATDPKYGKNMSCTLLIHVSEKWKFCQILLQDSEQILECSLDIKKLHKKQRRICSVIDRFQ